MEITKEEREEVERAMWRYEEIQRRKSELSEKDKKLLEQIKAVDLGYYDVSASIALMITDVYLNDALEAFCTIYRLGFLKGMRKAKADMKRKNK